MRAKSYVTAIDQHNNVAFDGTAENPHRIDVIDNPYKIVINEFMYDPPGAEPREEWIELYNAADSA